jgi:hypothetical protein
MDALGDRRRRRLAPQVVYQSLRRDQLIRVQQQHRQQRPLLSSAKRQRAVVLDHLERAEEPEVHGSSRPHGALTTRRSTMRHHRLTRSGTAQRRATPDPRRAKMTAMLRPRHARRPPRPDRVRARRGRSLVRRARGVCGGGRRGHRSPWDGGDLRTRRSRGRLCGGRRGRRDDPARRPRRPPRARARGAGCVARRARTSRGRDVRGRRAADRVARGARQQPPALLLRSPTRHRAAAHARAATGARSGGSSGASSATGAGGLSSSPSPAPRAASVSAAR